MARVPTPKPWEAYSRPLFRQHRRKGTVAKFLNITGYRTREGKPWRDMSVWRVLEESSAKGIYYFNRSKSMAPGSRRRSRRAYGAG